MTLEELETVDKGIRALPERLEKMSGIYAVISGLILIEIKSRLAHKEWTPWLRLNHGKAVRTAQSYMKIAKSFLENGRAFEPQQLTLALLDETQNGALDMTHPVVLAVAKWADGRSYRALRDQEMGDGRENNPGGFRPNALILRAWLEENYPQHPEYLEFASCFSSLPEEVQKRFRTEGKRYEQRFTKEQLEELETAEAARGWNTRAPKTIFDALDNGFFDRAENDQLSEWQKALGDALERVNRQVRDRATLKKGKAAK